MRPESYFSRASLNGSCFDVGQLYDTITADSVNRSCAPELMAGLNVLNNQHQTSRFGYAMAHTCFALDSRSWSVYCKIATVLLHVETACIRVVGTSKVGPRASAPDEV